MQSAICQSERHFKKTFFDRKLQIQFLMSYKFEAGL